MKSEPIRWAVYVAAVLAAISTGLIDYSNGLPLLEVLGKALTAVIPVLVGGELARARAWAPSSVDEVMDADRVISEAERAGNG